MKKKIGRHMLCLAAATIFICIILMVSLFYKIFQNQIFEDLKTDAKIYSSAIILMDGTEEEIAKIAENVESVRITVVDKEGTVLFDSVADQLSMDNHISRPEIAKAIEQGEGTSVRQSDTMNKSTFYYAIRLENGYILRIAKEAYSIWSIYLNSTSVIATVILTMIVICMWLSKYLTDSIVKPIEELGHNIDQIGEIETYEELRPFIKTISDQHDAIIKNAMLRQDFTANVTHELKTPLTAISGYSELIETGMATNDDTIRFAAGIHKSANRLLTLINNSIR